jgi:hypothetical protein
MPTLNCLWPIVDAQSSTLHTAYFSSPCLCDEMRQGGCNLVSQTRLGSALLALIADTNRQDQAKSTGGFQ